MKIKIFILFLLVTFCLKVNSQTDPVQKLYPGNGTLDDAYGSSVNVYDNYAIVGVPGSDEFGINSGSAYIYQKVGQTWEKQAFLVADDANEYNYFGNSVAISGDYAIVGSFINYQHYYCSAYVFKNNNGNWEQIQKLAPSDGEPISGWFGQSVSISGDYTIIGAGSKKHNGISVGAAYIFYNNNGIWEEQAKLIADDGETDDCFGQSVCLDGNNAIIGAYYDDDNGERSGSAYIFSNNNGNWVQQKKLIASDANINDQYGTSVYINGNYAMVGSPNAPNESGIGSIYIVKNEAGNWTEVQKIQGSDPNHTYRFGRAITISGDYAVFGNPYNDTAGTGTGIFYLYHNNNDIWEEQNMILAEDGNYNDWFGCSVSINDSTLFIGANGDYTSGSIYIYEKDLMNWNFHSKLTPEFRYDALKFGKSITISENTLIIGSETNINTGKLYIYNNSTGSWIKEYENTEHYGSAFGATLDISGDYAITRGSERAILFKKENGNWGYFQTISADDHYIYAEFGCSVSISENYAIIGAYNDKEFGIASGSAYIFYNNNGNWEKSQKILAFDGEEYDRFGKSVLIEGDWAFISASKDDGTVYVYKDNSGIWEFETKLISSDGFDGQLYSYSMAIYGDFFIIGTYLKDNKGAAYLFKNNNGIWEEYAKLQPDDLSSEDYFGRSVSISEDHIIIGSIRDDENNSNSGSIYLYDNNNGTWVEKAKLRAKNGQTNDNFGLGTSISGNNLSIGMTLEDYNDENSGSVFMYDLNLLPNITSQAEDELETGVNTTVYFNISGENINYYQWQVSTNGQDYFDIADNKSYSGSLTAELQVSVTNEMDGNFYRCIIYSDKYTEMISNTAKLTFETQAPVISSVHNDVFLGDGIQCDVILDDYTTEVIATDNFDPNPIITQNPIPGTLISGTTNLVTLTVTDNAGNSSQVSFNAEVLDTTSPEIFSTHTNQSYEADENCQLILPDFTQSIIASDNCDTYLQIEQFPVSGSVLTEFINPVTLRISDNKGNYDEVSFIVEITDNLSPVIYSAHNDTIIVNNDNCNAILPDFKLEMNVSDNCDSNLEISQIPETGTLISGQTNLIRLTATDYSGNYSEVSFNVEVIDNIKPIINSNHNNQIIGDGIVCEANLPDYKVFVEAIDNCDTELNISQSPVSGTLISGLINQVILTVTDDAGNFSETIFNVEVFDNTNPSINSTHNDQSIDADSNCEASLPDYTSDVTASDNCDVNLDVTQNPIPGTIISGANNLIKLTVTDDSGNYSDVIFNVEVSDNANPVINCIGNQEVDVYTSNTYTVSGTEFDPMTTNDNCGVASIINDFNSSATLNDVELPEGSTTIIWTITDIAGNIETCNFDVVVTSHVGISNLIKNNISIYPNPTTGQLTIDFTKVQNFGKVMLQIQDITGKILIEKSNLQQNKELDLSGFANGIYIIIIQTEEDVFTSKIVKE